MNSFVRPRIATFRDISYPVTCHQRAQNIGFKTRDIYSLIPARKVNAIELCSGLNGTYAEHFTSDCPMAATHISNLANSEKKPEHLSEFEHASRNNSRGKIFGHQSNIQSDDSHLAQKSWRTKRIVKLHWVPMLGLFEDQITISYQIQEMLRIECIYEAGAIQEELGTYNPLVPDGKNPKSTPYA
jgi:glycerol-3-phosphate dehydrogenase subunit C